MKKSEQYIRYPSSTSEEKLANKFGLYWDINMQDWDLVVSDFGLIKDFLVVYQNELENDDDKFTLMGLIVSSFDDGIFNFNQETENNWNICKLILEKECYLHYSTIVYWSLLENSVGNLLPISPYIRQVWEKVKVNFS